MTRFHAHAYPHSRRWLQPKLRHTPIAPAHHTLTDHAAPSKAVFIVRERNNTRRDHTSRDTASLYGQTAW
ncbi:hypothetical protein H8K38_01905 [Undibacterium sp. FT79W]|uniref:hypothetical protein n=1 Tax=Undibacterium sp. FT79W TaxID=2762296 RepID=UPI00164C323F|nr:hypothetical protein [Undibacterium sp. FT79W]MBC3876553.1 hypothetical protein [Undibacterium sp. FT79W]